MKTVSRDIKLDRVDKIIQGLLKSRKVPLSTYDIAKKAKISWATANIHCYKLMAFGVLNCKNEEVKIGMKRVVWWLK